MSFPCIMFLWWLSHAKIYQVIQEAIRTYFQDKVLKKTDLKRLSNFTTLNLSLFFRTKTSLALDLWWYVEPEYNMEYMPVGFFC